MKPIDLPGHPSISERFSEVSESEVVVLQDQ
jgi:hypothetical protein